MPPRPKTSFTIDTDIPGRPRGLPWIREQRSLLFTLFSGGFFDVLNEGDPLGFRSLVQHLTGQRHPPSSASSAKEAVEPLANN